MAARAPLGLLALNGTLIPGGALRCQIETARPMEEHDGAWLFTPKANRPVQHAQAMAWFADPHARPEPAHMTTDANHGRVERRHSPWYGLPHGPVPTEDHECVRQ